MKRLWGFVLAAVAVTGFASTFVAGSALTKECGVSPSVLAFLRFLAAGAVLLAFEGASASGRRALCAAKRADWPKLAVLGTIGTSVMAWCVFAGCARVGTANASMADALAPLMISAAAAIQARRLEFRLVFGLLCGFLGALLVIQVVTFRGVRLEAYSAGDVYVLFAALTWAVYTVWGRSYAVRMGASAFSVWTMLSGAAAIGLVLPFAPVVWPQTLKAWGLVGVLAVFSTLAPYWAWNAAQKHLPVTVLGVSAYFTPVAAVALAALFRDERATLLQWIGTGFICVSAVVETRRAGGAERNVSPQPRKL